MQVVSYEISADWDKAAREYALDHIKNEQSTEISERRGFKTTVQVKMVGMLGELAVEEFCKDYAIPYEIGSCGFNRPGHDITIMDCRYEIKTIKSAGSYTEDWAAKIVSDQFERYRIESPYGYIFCIVVPNEVHIVGYIAHKRFNTLKIYADIGDKLSDGYVIKKAPCYYVLMDDLEDIRMFFHQSDAIQRGMVMSDKRLELGDFM